MRVGKTWSLDRQYDDSPVQAVRHITDSTVDDLVRFLLAASEAYNVRLSAANALAASAAADDLPGATVMGLVRSPSASSQRLIAGGSEQQPEQALQVRGDEHPQQQQPAAAAPAGGNSESESASMYLSAYSLLVSDCAATARALETLDDGVDEAVTSALDLAGASED